MSIEQDQKWITGPELGDERCRLMSAGVPHDAPEYNALWARVDARDEYLWNRYGQKYRETHPDKWIAISLEGEVIIGDRPGEVSRKAREAYGGGNFALRKLAEFPGLRTGLG